MLLINSRNSKCIKTLALGFCLVLSSSIESFANTEQPKQPEKWAHQFTLGLESFKYHYEESTPEHKNFMQDNGMMYGINGAYQLTYKDRIFIRPEARLVYGHADYNGRYGRESDRMNKIPSAIIEPRLLIGSPLRTTEQLTLSPYVGIGWRYKWDDSSDVMGTEGAPGMKRINETWYIPLGARFDYRLNEQWFVQGLAEYDWFLSGKQYTYRKNSVPYPLVNKQKKGWGAKGEFLVGRHFEDYSVAFGPYLHYWKIKKSKDVSGNYVLKGITGRIRELPFAGTNEPNNITKEIGLKLTLYF